MRVLCVSWKRDIPLDLALGRTIDTRARGVATLEYVRKMRGHAPRYVRPRRNERQIDSHGSANQGLIGGIAPPEKVETSRKYEGTSVPLVSRIARDSISRYDGR